jgi:hypothetical protein
MVVVPFGETLGAVRSHRGHEPEALFEHELLDLWDEDHYGSAYVVAQKSSTCSGSETKTCPSATLPSRNRKA